MERIWVDRDKCLGCKTCELQCAVERDSVSKRLALAAYEMPRPQPRVRVLGESGAGFPLQCRHCEDATCIAACPAGAMQRDAHSGLVFVEQDRCRGCWMCVMSCPFGAVAPSVAFKVAVKCDACRLRERPACVDACPTGALRYGDEASFLSVLAARGRRAGAEAAGA